MIEALLKAGADQIRPTKPAKTPLMLVARTGNLNASKALLNSSGFANVNGADEFKGYTPLMFAATENQPDHARRC
jgi:ankyrin repeat protein